MCGIIGKFGGKIDKRAFQKARDVMVHRGPNDAGIFYDTKTSLALGHRRLSIIDTTSAGHQPMVSDDGRYVLVFNGEIFNYLELREELKKRYTFKTQSDTEVLLAAYAVWGKDALPKLNGQFAFAVWDTVKKELLLARDHFGIKPLFYHRAGGTLTFASESKALHALDVPQEPNDGVIFDFLAYELYDHTQETFFKDIHMLPPAHYALVRKGSFTARPYWNFSEEVKKQEIPQTREEASLKFHDLLEDAIRLQLRSDVPVGITLSSGIDSSTMLHFVRNLLGDRVHAFTSGLEDEIYDECKYIKPWVSKDAGVTWHTSSMKPAEVFALTEKLRAVEDQPYGGMHTAQYFNLYQTHQQTPVTVLLEGQGMDEMLAGYRHFVPEKREQYIRSFLERRVKPEYLAGDFEKEIGGSRTLSVEQPFSDALQNAQYIDLRYRKLPRTLRFNDHIAMNFSKELRVPFLDPRLVTFGFALPEEYKIQGGTGKHLLRSLIQDRIPHAMREKDHVEFPAFQTEWFRKYFRGEVMDIVHSASFRSRPYWDHKKVVDRVDRFFKGEGHNSFFLWQMIDLEKWLQVVGKRF